MKAQSRVNHRDLASFRLVEMGLTGETRRCRKKAMLGLARGQERTLQWETWAIGRLSEFREGLKGSGACGVAISGAPAVPRVGAYLSPPCPA